MDPRVGTAREDAFTRLAFTRLELAVVLATVALAAGVVLPALAQGRPRSLQAVCANNLRDDWTRGRPVQRRERGRDPWRVNNNTGIGNNAWYQFLSFSNEVRDPRVLVCPSDAVARPAKNYSLLADGGFLNPRYQNNAVSYALGLIPRRCVRIPSWPAIGTCAIPA